MDEADADFVGELVLDILATASEECVDATVEVATMTLVMRLPDGTLEVHALAASRGAA